MCKSAAGGRSGMILHNAYGYGLFTGGLGLGAHYGAERLGCTVAEGVSGSAQVRRCEVRLQWRSRCGSASR